MALYRANTQVNTYISNKSYILIGENFIRSLVFIYVRHMFCIHFGSRWYPQARNFLHWKYRLTIFYKGLYKGYKTKVDVFISLPYSLKGIELTTVGKTRNNNIDFLNYRQNIKRYGKRKKCLEIIYVIDNASFPLSRKTNN